MHRMNMMRQIHDWRESLIDRRALLKLCSNEAMPSGWSVEQDEELFKVVDENGLDNISANIVNKPAFQKLEQFPFAAAAVAQSGGFLLPSLLSSGAGSSSAAAQAQAAMLSALFSLPPVAPVPTSSASSSALKQEYGEDVLNLSTKKSQSSSTGTSSADRPSTSMVSEQAANILNNLNITELFALANLPPGQSCFTLKTQILSPYNFERGV
ncbi:unnamed protein product [Gongylonema pulchrum]|uniref:SANT domain-containing protein n=1 Tax=Gongylonema pulchrum TaxID=637853 RepID=A0A183ETH3_9BILA|nr:unnamed protein product [Gongylonema pulchrum]